MNQQRIRTVLQNVEFGQSQVPQNHPHIYKDVGNIQNVAAVITEINHNQRVTFTWNQQHLVKLPPNPNQQAPLKQTQTRIVGNLVDRKSPNQHVPREIKSVISNFCFGNQNLQIMDDFQLSTRFGLNYLNLRFG